MVTAVVTACFRVNCWHFVTMMLAPAIASPRCPCCVCVRATMQLMYLALACGGFGLFVKDAYPHIPNPYMDSYHKCVAVLR